MHAPAAGEGAAVAGYHYQYLASAALVLKGLLNGSLDWVRIKDIEAGRVDDFVLNQGNRIDAYQFKHRASGNFTFRDLIRGTSTSSRDTGTTDVMITDESSDTRQHPSLIQQLAEGWQLLRDSHGPSITVHLVTNVSASRNDRIEIATNSAGLRHLTAFIDEVWIPAQNTAAHLPLVIPEKWGPAWEEVRAASGLDSNSFTRFVRSCRLEFTVEPTTLLDHNATRDAHRTLSEVDHIRRILFDLAAREPAPVHLERHRLLERLGWSSRFRSRNAHIFPVDEALYQPIDASVSELEDKLNAIDGGYLGVFGSPGSGKSTLLTQVLRFRPERIIRYYAFVQESIGLNIGRGESENFLHDLVLALHNEGFSAGEGTIDFDRSTLYERFYNQLEMLGQDWHVNGNKTIILIDGLDHVSRGPRPAHSFLDDLPEPGTIPEGVVFVLGSQSDVVLPVSTRMAVQEPQRRVEIQPLSRDEILTVIDRSDPDASLSQAHRARLVELSAGHPLALVYILNSIEQAGSLEDVDTFLDSTPVFSGDIAVRYEAAWSQVASDASVVQALGYAARMRGHVELGWLETWLGFEPLRKLQQHFGHFFRRELGNRAYFFHDSFRVFLAERTSEDWQRQPDPARDARLHRDLADRFSQEPSSSRLAWEEVHHRVQAKQDDVVIERATQEYFRNQVLALRPIAAIRDDVNLAVQVAGRQRSLVAFSRLILAGAELEQRQFHLEQVPFIRLLIELGESVTAVEHVRERGRLRISSEKALEVIPDLIDSGLQVEAARIFDLAEPLELLRPGTPVDDEPHSVARSLLFAWAEVATRYRSVERVIGIARGLSVVPQRWHQGSSEENDRSLQNAVIFHTAMGLTREERWSDVTEIAGNLDPSKESDRNWWIWIHVHAWRAAAKVDIDEARALLEVVSSRFKPSDLDTKVRLEVATAAFRLVGNEDFARQWIEGVPRPDVDILSFGGDWGLSPIRRAICVHAHPVHH